MGDQGDSRGGVISLHNGDCLDILPTLPAHSVDMILADPPYGTTACKWDSVIPFVPMWEAIERVIKPNGAVVLFGSQPFTSALVMSKPRWFKYCWTWDKERGVGHLVAKYRPMQRTEDIAVFGRSTIKYHPVMQKRPKPEWSIERGRRSAIMGNHKSVTHEGKMLTHRHPTTVLAFPWSPTVTLHPTQKPVALLAYLIRTYTNKGETVLDFCMGSGSTGAACIEEGRDFIGIEKDAEYYRIAAERIERERTKPRTLRMEMTPDLPY
jgi:DNA modification methylase